MSNAAVFRDRIKEFRRVKASDLAPNPKNWREHPLAQKKALKAILEDVGFAGAVLAREDDDGNLILIDGHARQNMAGNQKIPVLILDVNEEEANKILLTFDPISMMAGTNQGNLDSLLREVNTSNQDLAGFLTSLAEANNLLSEIANSPTILNPSSGSPADDGDESDEYGESDYIERDSPGADSGDVQSADALPTDPGVPLDTGIFQYNPNAIFASRNAWDIPDLLPDQMAGLEHVPTETWVHPKDPTDPKKTLFLWGTNRFPEGKTEGGLVGFYVDDVRFESIWNSPVEALDLIRRNRFAAAIMPDFSLDWEWPLAMQVWQIYRARWMARFWQEAGIKIIPNLSYGNDRTIPWINAGVPKNTPLVAVQTRTLRGKDIEGNRRFMIDRIERAIDEINPQGILLYGGTQHREWLAPLVESSVGTQFFFVDSWTLVRDRLRFNRKDKQ